MIWKISNEKLVEEAKGEKEFFQYKEKLLKIYLLKNKYII
jgi:hypothetical protein